MTTTTVWPPTLDVHQVAGLLGCSPDALYAAIRSGEAPVPVLRVGRAIRIPTRPFLGLLGLPGDITPGATPPEPTAPAVSPSTTPARSTRPQEITHDATPT